MRITAEQAASQISRAYRTHNSEYVSFAQIADHVDLTKCELAAGVRHLMQHVSNFHCIPESNQKVLLPEERAAAVMIGNQAKHWITWQ